MPFAPKPTLVVALLGSACLTNACGGIFGIHDIQPPLDGSAGDGNGSLTDGEVGGNDVQVDGRTGTSSGGTVVDASSDSSSHPMDGAVDGPGATHDATPESGGEGGACGTIDTACGPSCQNCTTSGQSCHGHSNGVGQTFYDCNPLGTYSQTQAMKACEALTGSASACTTMSAFRCQLAGFSTLTVVCSSGSAGCYCWQWSVSPGSVAAPPSFGGCQTCPSSSPTWN
jgi:hypothetical protein